MKKNIVVLVSEIANDYTFAVLNGINQFFAGKEVNLFIVCTKRMNNLAGKQYWTEMKFAEGEEIDGVIVVSAVYLSFISKKELAEHISKIHTDNIVSISANLPVKNSIYTYISCKEAYNQIIKYLKEEQGCKTFAFMSAIATGSEEAKERFDAFIAALKKNGLDFDDKRRFEGRFVYDSALEVLKERYKKKSDVDFDAILAANDMMAFAAIDALESIGVKIPEEVKVVGYDDITQAQTAELPLSTINQQMELQGRTAAELVWNKANGLAVPKKTPIKIKPIFRESSGYLKSETDLLAKAKTQNGTQNMSIALYLEKQMIQQNIYYLLESLQNEMTLDILFSMFDTILPENYIPAIAMCFYDKPLLVSEEVPLTLPDKATVKVFIDKKKNIKNTNLNVSFDPRKIIIPQKFLGSKPGIFMTHPIFFGHKQYGYFVCRTPSTEYLFTMIYLKTFSTIISQSYIYTKQLEENAKLTSENLMLQIDNSELNVISMNDSLTGVFNRRGLVEMGNETIKLAIKMGSKGVVFFADMDYLKKINDKYGHEMGDKAIKTEAEVFKTIFRQNDIICRLGGDEFAGVIPGLPIEHIEKTKETIKETCKTLSKANGLPFEISISFGAVEFNSENCDLDTLIKLADKEQYKEKRKHHSARK